MGLWCLMDIRLRATQPLQLALMSLQRVPDGVVSKLLVMGGVGVGGVGGVRWRPFRDLVRNATGGLVAQRWGV